MLKQNGFPVFYPFFIIIKPLRAQCWKWSTQQNTTKSPEANSVGTVCKYSAATSGSAATAYLSSPSYFMRPSTGDPRSDPPPETSPGDKVLSTKNSMHWVWEHAVIAKKERKKESQAADREIIEPGRKTLKWRPLGRWPHWGDTLIPMANLGAWRSGQASEQGCDAMSCPCL